MFIWYAAERRATLYSIEYDGGCGLQENDKKPPPAPPSSVMMDTELVGFPRPYAPTGRCMHEMVMRMLPAPSVIFREEDMLLMVEVCRKREGIRVIAEQSRELGALVVGLWRHERHMHEENHESLVRNKAQVVTKEFHLTLTMLTQKPGTRQHSITRDHEDVVEHNEVYLAVVESIVGGAIDTFKGLIREFVIRCIPMYIMIPDDVEPGDADLRDGLVDLFEQGQLIMNDVSQCDSERGIYAHELLDHIMREVAHIALVSNLYIPEHNHTEAPFFLRPVEREI
jgi:hypothetical protein